MKCYRCPTKVLKPVKLVERLPAKECGECSGVLLDLLSYRSWKEDYADDVQVGEFDASVVQDGESALNCQRCNKLMLRYRVAAEYSNYVDVCSTCDVVWLDGGEWELLAHMDAADKLTDIMSAPWQAAVRQQKMAAISQADLRKEVGDEGVEKLEKFATWFNSLADKSAATRFLRERKVP